MPGLYFSAFLFVLFVSLLVGANEHGLFAHTAKAPFALTLNTLTQAVPKVHIASGCTQFVDFSRIPWSATKKYTWIGSGAANFVFSQVGSKYVSRVGLMHAGPHTVSADVTPFYWAFQFIIDQSSAFGRLLLWALLQVPDKFGGSKHIVPFDVHFKERDHSSRLPAVPGMFFGVDTPVYQHVLCLNDVDAVRELCNRYSELVPPIMMNIEIHHRANCSLGDFLTLYPAGVSFMDLGVVSLGYVHDQLLMTETSNFTFTDAHEGNLLVIRTEDGRLIVLFADPGQTSDVTREKSQLDRVVLRIRGALLRAWERVPQYDATYHALSDSHRLAVDRYMPQVIGSLRARRDDESSVVQYLRNMQVDINNAITAMIAAADLRDEFDRRLGASSLLSLHVRTIRQGQDIISLQLANKTTNSKLNATQAELNETKAELNETKAELNETKAELNSKLNVTQAQLNATQAELTETKAALEVTNSKLNATQAKVDKLSRDFVNLMQQFADSKNQSRSESRDES